MVAQGKLLICALYETTTDSPIRMFLQDSAYTRESDICIQKSRVHGDMEMQENFGRAEVVLCIQEICLDYIRI